MSFWRTFGFHTVSPIDQILDQESFTLEELMDEDDLLTECKSQNKKLLDFILQPEQLKKLFEYLLEEADEDADDKRRFKYPYLASEVLCMEVWDISDAVYDHEELLDELWSFLYREAPLNPILCTYVTRVAGVLLQRKIAPTVDYLKQKEGIVQRFIAHLENSAVMDLLLKVIACEETTEASGVLNWLNDAALVPSMIAKFEPSNAPEVHENVAQALVNIIEQSGGLAESPLMDVMESKDNMSKLFGFVANSDSKSVLLNALLVVCKLLERNGREPHELDIDTDLDELPPLVSVGLANLDEFVQLLRLGPAARKNKSLGASSSSSSSSVAAAASSAAGIDGDDNGERPSESDATKSTEQSQQEEQQQQQQQEEQQQEEQKDTLVASESNTKSNTLLKTSYGQEIVPVGPERLQVIDFIAGIVRLRYQSVDLALVKSGALSACFDLFFEYRWNNFLHQLVADLIGDVCEGRDDVLKAAMIRECGLCTKLIKAAEGNESDLQLEKGISRGYMGFVTRLSNILVSVAQSEDDVAAILAEQPGWDDYVTGLLAKSNEQNSVDEYRCSRALQSGSSSGSDPGYDVGMESSELVSVFTQYLAKQGFSGTYPTSFDGDDPDDDDDYDDDDDLPPDPEVTAQANASATDGNDSDSDGDNNNNNNNDDEDDDDDSGDRDNSDSDNDNNNTTSEAASNDAATAPTKHRLVLDHGFEQGSEPYSTDDHNAYYDSDSDSDDDADSNDNGDDGEFDEHEFN